MALGKQMKVRPADLLGHLWGLLYCKWQRPLVPSLSKFLCPCLLYPIYIAAPLSVGSEERYPNQRPLARPQPAGTLTSSNDLQLGPSLFSSSTQSQHNLQHMPLSRLAVLHAPSLVQLCSIYDLNQTASARTGWSSPQECALIKVHPQG